MYPDQPPTQQPYSIDYLNQIAPQQEKPGLSNKLFMAIIGGGLLLAIIVGIFIFTSGGSGGPTSKIQTLAARLEALKDVSDKAQKNIKSGTLRTTNSTLAIFLTNANRDITGPLASNSADTAAPDKTIAATVAKDTEALTKKLEDARLNAIYDRIYAREMSYQLEVIAALMKDIYSTNNSKSLKDYLTATDANLAPIAKQLTDFNAANG